MSRRWITLWLDDHDHYTLAALQARYQFTTLPGTVRFAIRTLARAQEHDDGKAAGDAAIREEVNASIALDLQQRRELHESRELYMGAWRMELCESARQLRQDARSLKAQAQMRRRKRKASYREPK